MRRCARRPAARVAPAVLLLLLACDGRRSDAGVAAPTAHAAQAAVTATVQRGREARNTPAAAATGKANTVSPRSRLSVLLRPNGASQISFR